MAQGVITLGEMRAKDMRMLEVACPRSERHGWLSIARLIAEHGRAHDLAPRIDPVVDRRLGGVGGSRLRLLQSDMPLLKNPRPPTVVIVGTSLAVLLAGLIIAWVLRGFRR